MIFLTGLFTMISEVETLFDHLFSEREGKRSGENLSLSSFLSLKKNKCLFHSFYSLPLPAHNSSHSSFCLFSFFLFLFLNYCRSFSFFAFSCFFVPITFILLYYNFIYSYSYLSGVFYSNIVYQNLTFTPNKTLSSIVLMA